MIKLLKDPLGHFLVVGTLLFAVAAWRGDTIEVGREEILVPAEEVARARAAAELLHGREPTAVEVAELVEPFVRAEVFYREALALGLDVDDDEVRRRLIEKMQYLTSDLADPEPASAAELRAFYDADPERFRVPELVSFAQVFFSPSVRGDTVRDDALAARAALAAGAAEPDALGDRTPLRAEYADAPREQVEVLFGPDFAAAVFAAEPGDWAGPYESDFGLHLVRLERRVPSRLPPFDEIRDRVRDTFALVRREERNAAEYARLRERYEIVVEEPRAARASGAD
jgi:hypothetical protein